MPEDISENMVKFIIRLRLGDATSNWPKSSTCTKKLSGDLVSLREGVQEVKCFTSDGPLSFGPKEAWNVIYFLDARNWLDNKYVLWRVNLSNTSNEWKNIKVNETQTIADQSAQGRRPRNSWEGIKNSLSKIDPEDEYKYYAKVFEGSFEDIFTKVEEPADSR